MALRPLEPGLAPDEVEKLRWDTFGHRRTHSLGSCKDLTAFTRARGFVLHRPEAGLHYPSVMEAAVGRPLFEHTWDERSRKAEGWVQECVAKREVVAVALLAQRQSLVAPRYLKDFFLLSGLQGDGEDPRRRREQGKLSQDGQALCAWLRREGRALAHSELAARMSMRGVLGTRRLGEAAQEGLRQLLLVIVDWKPRKEKPAEPVYDLLSRACANVLSSTRKGSALAARRRILSRYLRNVLVEGCHEMARVLSWSEDETLEALRALEKRREVLQHPSSRHNRWIYQAAATDLLP